MITATPLPTLALAKVPAFALVRLTASVPITPFNAAPEMVATVVASYLRFSAVAPVTLSGAGVIVSTPGKVASVTALPPLLAVVPFRFTAMV